MNAVREDEVGATRREEADDIDPDPRWTLVGYRREYRGTMDGGCFSAMDVDGKNVVDYNRNNVQLDTALGAWERRWELLRKCCAWNQNDVRFEIFVAYTMGARGILLAQNA